MGNTMNYLSLRYFIKRVKAPWGTSTRTFKIRQISRSVLLLLLWLKTHSFVIMLITDGPQQVGLQQVEGSRCNEASWPGFISSFHPLPSRISLSDSVMSAVVRALSQDQAPPERSLPAGVVVPLTLYPPRPSAPSHWRRWHLVWSGWCSLKSLTHETHMRTELTGCRGKGQVCSPRA